MITNFTEIELIVDKNHHYVLHLGDYDDTTSSSDLGEKMSLVESTKEQNLFGRGPYI